CSVRCSIFAILPYTSLFRSRRRGGSAPAPVRPVARVLIETAVPHLARTFDYGVTDTQDADALAGVRVRVRFSGRLVSGFLLERRSEEHTSELQSRCDLVCRR